MGTLAHPGGLRGPGRDFADGVLVRMHHDAHSGEAHRPVIDDHRGPVPFHPALVAAGGGEKASFISIMPWI